MSGNELITIEGTTHRPCFMHFCFKAPYQFTPLLNFCRLIFSLMPSGWLCSYYAAKNLKLKLHNKTGRQDTD